MEPDVAQALDPPVDLQCARRRCGTGLFCFCTERSGSFEQRLTAARGRWRGFARGSTLFTAMTDVSVYNNMMYYVLQFKG